ncbi:MAG: DoxX family protein [Desulfurococcaceae archaeon]|nr:DoxX family protein [Desulfurococcaceae archaeon]
MIYVVEVVDVVFIIGRLIFGGYWVLNGLNHFINMKMMADFTIQRGVPFPAELSVAVTGLMMLLGGLTIILGVYTYIGMALIILFLLSAMIFVHRFWEMSDPMARMMEMVLFMRNAAYIGVLLMLYTLGDTWPFNVFDLIGG